MTTSIIILTVNQLAVTQQCLGSIRQNTPESYELIVVDNGSTDGTIEYLKSQPDIKAVFNSSNLGFAKGCNQGRELASGDNILFLNNDTVVTENWLGNMLRLLYSQPQIGLVGPVSNKANGHQQINVSYAELSGLVDFAREYCAKNAGCYRRVFRLVGFCLLVKKEVINQVGGFDELFGLGNVKDDDFCLRAVRAGYHLMIALDSFVHHIAQLTFNSIQEGSFKKLMEENQEKAIVKWGFNIGNYLDDLQTKIESKQDGKAPNRDLQSYESRLEVGEKLASQELYYFANELLNRRRYEQAVEFYEKFLATDQGEVEDKIAACGKVADIYLKLGDQESMKKYIFLSFGYDTPRAEFCCRLGFSALEERDYKAAIVWYRIATQLEMPTEYSDSVNKACWTWLPHLQLAVCYDRVGKLELGHRHNEFARNFVPQDNRVVHNRTYFKNILGPRRTAEIDAQVQAELRRKKLLPPGEKSDVAPSYWENGKIFLGCGNLKLDEFINVDCYQTSATDVILDWEQPLPFNETKIKCVFSNSFLEHFERGKIQGHLKEVYASLGDDGYFCYIGLPYFRNIASLYLENSSGTNGPLFSLQNVYQYTHDPLDNVGESSINNYQRHKSIFDEPELHVLLRAAGVRNYLLFTYAFPGDENELPVLSGFYAEKSGDFTENGLKAACQSFLSRFDGKMIRLDTLAYLSCVIDRSQVSSRGRENGPLRFVTMFPGAGNFHLVKGLGMIPFIMHKYYGYESFMACYDNGPYDYLKDEVKGLQTWFIDRVTGDTQKDGIEFLRAHAQEIDVLNLLHLISTSFVWASIYKALNPAGKVFLKLDANYNIKNANWPNAKEILKNFDLISVETTGYQEFLRKAWSMNVERLPTGFYDGGRREIVDFSNKENVILTVGRIGSTEKANHILLEAFKIVADLLPGWKVKLVGTVTDRFENYVSELLADRPELKDRIILTGHLFDRKKLREEYKKAKVFCLTSLWEGFPNVFPEAQQNGCFIISSDLSPAWDITDNKRFGDIFPVNDVKSLADSLLRNCKDEETLRRVCREAQDYAYENFNWVEICRKLDNSLKENGK
ncbi:glycosyltransferase [Desulfosporosinus sp. OT]|uniref:glycosyltransferase n=1 Tax=Desulfosporosinus sp. OT TaxID=913865 RepID=UPI000223AE5A|nr:glycosyltransferase [Desulfosporosinus sp. OT]EGW36167.1 glycosyl transferase 2 family protein [Desulfosporosinus sp. OT]